MLKLRNGSKGGFEPGLSRLRVRHSTNELPCSIVHILAFSNKSGAIAKSKSLLFPIEIVVNLTSVQTEREARVSQRHVPARNNTLPSSPWKIISKFLHHSDVEKFLVTRID